MADVEVNVRALYQALDVRRKTKDLSWREVARQADVHASTMSRLAQGLSPDVKAFARMLRWLGEDAETFILEDGRPVKHQLDPTQPEPELLVELAPLLRARKDLDERDVHFLEELIGSAMRRFSAERKPTGE